MQADVNAATLHSVLSDLVPRRGQPRDFNAPVHAPYFDPMAAAEVDAREEFAADSADMDDSIGSFGA